MTVSQKEIFKSYLDLFDELTFPISLSYNIYDIDPFHSEPIPSTYLKLFIEDEDNQPNTSSFGMDEYISIGKYQVEKKFTACILWKASPGAYEFILLLYDVNGAIIDTETIAGTYYHTTPMIYKVANIISSNEIFVLESPWNERSEQEINLEKTNKMKLEINEQGEILTTLLTNTNQ